MNAQTVFAVKTVVAVLVLRLVQQWHFLWVLQVDGTLIYLDV